MPTSFVAPSGYSECHEPTGHGRVGGVFVDGLNLAGHLCKCRTLLGRHKDGRKKHIPGLPGPYVTLYDVRYLL